jgi:hypothetical protein
MTASLPAKAVANNTPGNPEPRKDSFSSFPPSRTPSNQSSANGIVHIQTERYARRYSSSSAETGLHVGRGSEDAQPYRSRRKLRSQYPRDSPDKHVEYILVASFDIDRGPIMEHQYPSAISGDESMLAELMLPDQTHVRSQDWTIFFLHKDPAANEEAQKARTEQQKTERRRKMEEGRLKREEHVREGLAEGAPVEDGHQSEVEGSAEESGIGENDEDEEEEEVEGGEGPPLIYVLNLVNTKQDTSAKRWHLHPNRCRATLISVIEGPLSKQWLYARGIPSYIFTR